MNGRVAKRIRREVYGDFSLRDRKYVLGEFPIRAEKRRSVYQLIKKAVKLGRG